MKLIESHIDVHYTFYGNNGKLEREGDAKLEVGATLFDLIRQECFKYTHPTDLADKINEFYDTYKYFKNDNALVDRKLSIDKYGKSILEDGDSISFYQKKKKKNKKEED